MRILLTSLLALGLTGAFTLALTQEGDEREAFRIFVTGADQGILEPCGCTGGQLGGIAWRGTLLEALTYNMPNLILSTGGLAGGGNTLHHIRFQILLLCLEEMGYRAAGLGPEELKLGLDKLREYKEYVEFPFLLSNVRFPGEADLPYQPALLTEAGGYTVRVLALIPESLKDQLPEEAEFVNPAEAVEEAVMAVPEADLTVVLLRGIREEAKELDDLLPDPKLVFYSYPHSESRVYDFFKRDGVIRFLSPGDRGRYIISCGLIENEEGVLEPVKPDETAIVPEDEELQSPAILTFMDYYKGMVLDEKVLEEMVEIEPAPEGAPYVGNGTCLLCHEQSYNTWKESGHGKAWKSLVDAKRDFDPECISCHVVGFGYQTGFRNGAETPFLYDVGCESCHGPCSVHVASAGRVKTPLKVDCATCHNLDHSPEFDEKPFWEKIACSPDGPYRLPGPLK